MEHVISPSTVSNTTEINERTPSPRGEAILEKLSFAFTQKGFDGTSMQELAKAADMSVGNFYRYFKSKDDIICAFVERDMQRMNREFQIIQETSDHTGAMRALLKDRLETTPRHEAALWAEMLANSFRKPDIAMISAGMDKAIIDNISSLLQQFTSGASVANPSSDKIAHHKDKGSAIDNDKAKLQMRMRAELLLLLVKGFAMRKNVVGVLDYTTEHEAEFRNFIIEFVFDKLLNLEEPATQSSQAQRPKSEIHQIK